MSDLPNFNKGEIIAAALKWHKYYSKRIKKGASIYKADWRLYDEVTFYKRRIKDEEKMRQIDIDSKKDQEDLANKEKLK